MGKKEYIKANREWLEAKAGEEGVMALPKGVLLQSAFGWKRQRRTPYSTKHCNGTLYRTHH